jgi:hypothetical protein
MLSAVHGIPVRAAWRTGIASRSGKVPIIRA